MAEAFVEPPRLLPTRGVVARRVEMRADEAQGWPARRAHRRRDGNPRLNVGGIGECVDGKLFQWPTAEQRLAVSAALIVHRLAVAEAQTGEASEFRRLIDAAGAGGFLVHLLQRHQVRT